MFLTKIRLSVRDCRQERHLSPAAAFSSMTTVLRLRESDTNPEPSPQRPGAKFTASTGPNTSFSERLQKVLRSAAGTFMLAVELTWCPVLKKLQESVDREPRAGPSRAGPDGRGPH